MRGEKKVCGRKQKSSYSITKDEEKKMYEGSDGFAVNYEEVRRSFLL